MRNSNSTNHLQHFLELSKDLMCKVSFDGNFKYINPIAEMLLGYTEKELISKSFLEFIHPEDRAKSNKQISKLLKAKTALNFENRIVSKDGSIKHIQWNATSDIKTKLIYFLGRDITERKEAEVELEKSEEKFKKVLNASPFPVAVGDTNNDIIFFWSQSAKDIFGHTPSTIHEWYELAYPDPDYRQEVIELWEPFIEKAFNSRESVNTGEYNITCSDGSIRICELYVTFLPNQIIVNFYDVTERKAAELAAKEGEEQLNALYNSMTEGVCQHELMLDDSGKAINYWILGVNNAYENMLGIKKEAVVGKLATEAYQVDEAPYLDFYAEVAQTGEAKHFETYFPQLKKYFSITAVRPGKNKFATIFEDVTERKSNEEELTKHRENLELLVEERTRKLNEANRELQDFVYSVSHDLRAPLRSIMGFSEIIASRHKESLNEEGLQYFNFIIEASHNMSNLIEDLLLYSRIGKKKIEQVDISEIIDKVLQDFSNNIAETGTEIILKDKFPTFQSNRVLLEQIFLNLIENAMKYHLPDAKPKIEISAKTDSKTLSIYIKDNGIGINSEYQEKIFNIFQRLHSNEEYPGTGIGLAIVKKSVAALNGKVWLSSKEKEGSTFFVEIPIVKENSNE